MALVAYAASDSDSITDEESDSGAVEIIPKPKETPEQNTPELGIFDKLPEPKTTNNLIDIEEENDEFLLKKEVPVEKPAKKPIRIVAPSLKDFDSDDDDEPKEKKAKVFSKASGLFSILPAPKLTTTTTKSFIPHAVQKKAKPAMKSNKSMVPQKTNTNTPSAAGAATGNAGTDDDEDDVPIEQFDANTWKQVCGRKTKVTSEPIVEIIDQSESANVIDINTAPEPVRPYDGLDNEAFKKLVGSSRMRPENIKFIDINEEEVLTEESILRTKALTDPEVETASHEEEPVSSMSKRKHHITYLAQQAKANEQDLKNRWAANRYSKKQTQAKYGF